MRELATQKDAGISGEIRVQDVPTRQSSKVLQFDCTLTQEHEELEQSRTPAVRDVPKQDLPVAHSAEDEQGRKSKVSPARTTLDAQAMAPEVSVIQVSPSSQSAPVVHVMFAVRHNQLSPLHDTLVPFASV
ncbi:hypothetical protein BWQ96_08431 [Gracilariopsis chorda]|uniref:Uncharacterized protein n=1 Tax=Gracilariopsis chorda TaxID=448386 RepID=A0A2V3IIF5_9FLOR|nr:hypothetical protein BWQ96_08431 [Gracilariopsis chorda]|eukprot:PXF41852.1 hypothetical protein BWQ96_08431 [Gracilariopsis chorda]